MIDITVAIPTYNGSQRIPQVLEKLRKQTEIKNLTWEVIIIDNNSNDDTVKVVQEYQDKNFLPVSLKYYFESQQGLAYARKRAIKEAQGEFVAFLDDDNFPYPNWIAEAVSFGKKYPQAGAYNGQIYGKYQSKPPENFDRLENYLAIRKHGEKPLLFEPDKLRLPPGAGLVVRKQAWTESVPPTSKLIGRVGNFKISGEDYEVLLYLHKAGWEIWYNPAMEIEHYIPSSRLERQYLFTVAMANGLATCQLRMINANFWQVPIIFIRTFLGNLRRVVIQYFRSRGKLNKDLIAEFELKFYLGSLFSCFYWLFRVVKLI
jgi:glycosyltransferase involved in cell wall biosynthesis